MEQQEQELSKQKVDGFSFGEALKELKAGNLVARKGWNGKNMFIFMRPEDTLDIDMIISKVKSLPQSLKDYYKKQMEGYVPFNNDRPRIKFTAYLCMKAADGTIVNGWLASQTDMLAEDWNII